MRSASLLGQSMKLRGADFTKVDRAIRCRGLRAAHSSLRVAALAADRQRDGDWHPLTRRCCNGSASRGLRNPARQLDTGGRRPGGHDVTLTHQHTIGIDIGKERQPVIAHHKLWRLSVCRGCQTGSQHQTGEADQDLSNPARYIRNLSIYGIRNLPIGKKILGTRSALRFAKFGTKVLMKSGLKSISAPDLSRFLCGFWTILCVSHEPPFRFPWASCKECRLV